MYCHKVWQHRILWRSMDAILRGDSRSPAKTTEAPALPTPESAAPPLIPELSATSTGQLTLF